MRNRRLRVDTHATIFGVEGEYVSVEVEISPPEPDVNFAGDIEITAVWYEDIGCVMDEMSDAEIEELTDRVDAELSQLDDPAELRADYLYDQRKDDALEGR